MRWLLYPWKIHEVVQNTESEVKVSGNIDRTKMLFLSQEAKVAVSINFFDSNQHKVFYRKNKLITK